MLSFLLLLFVEPEQVIQYDSPVVINVPLKPVQGPQQEVKEEYNVLCECVATARIYSKFELPRQHAYQFKPNSVPTVGGLVLMRYGDLSHVAVIMAIMPGGIYVREGNYKKCEYSERFIQWDDSRIIGFWSSEVLTSNN